MLCVSCRASHLAHGTVRWTVSKPLLVMAVTLSIPIYPELSSLTLDRGHCPATLCETAENLLQVLKG